MEEDKFDMENYFEHKNEHSMKMILNTIIHNLKYDNFSKLIDASQKLNENILIFCENVKSTKDIIILVSYLNQGIQLINDMLKKEGN